MTTRVTAGDALAPRELPTLIGPPAPLPDLERLTDLQFRRYATCPICNFHLREFQSRRDEIAASGAREVVVFYSTAEQLRAFQAKLPFDVPDPDRTLYREFGVAWSARAITHQRSWLAHAYDQWAVDDLLALARSWPTQ